ncbi:MAG: DNA-directed RNA polymerase subunit omega [Coriobacteriia bacterium]|nr:DNA-directed RNA polymerase subunit omega [Coriobacteriia bacterium]
MSLVEPKIDVLLDNSDNDRFLLCSVASKRANDLNDMMHSQHVRAQDVDAAVELARANHNRALSMAFEEIADNEITCDEDTIDDIKAH